MQNLFTSSRVIDSTFWFTTHALKRVGWPCQKLNSVNTEAFTCGFSSMFLGLLSCWKTQPRPIWPAFGRGKQIFISNMLMLLEFLIPGVNKVPHLPIYFSKFVNVNVVLKKKENTGFTEASYFKCDSTGRHNGLEWNYKKGELDIK